MYLHVPFCRHRCHYCDFYRLEPDALQEHYRQRNLLESTISAEDVGQAVLFFAARRTPTTGAVLPVDGGVAGAFPR